MNTRNTAILIVVFSCLLWSLARAGDLNPPAGPIASTMKTLDQIEPRIPIGPATTPGDASSTYIISEPGSYYLTGELIGELYKHGISIVSNNVSIDLMGFTLRGNGGGTSGNGITTVGGNTLESITLRNGFVTDWPETGVLLNMGNIIIEDLVVADNGELGISCDSHALVRRSISHGNENGIRIGLASKVETSIATDNDNDGIIVLGSGSTVDACITRLNGHGIRMGSFAGRVFECIAASNQDGISLRGSAAESCISYINTITLEERGCTVSGSVVAPANFGIAADATATGARVSGNVVVGYSLDGIQILSDGAVISNNLFYSTDGFNGIDVRNTDVPVSGS